MGWADQVKDRDGGRCFICGKKSDLYAHHLFSRNIYPELTDEVDNGRTLCGKHHKGFHKAFGYGNNTGFQFMKYLKQFREKDQAEENGHVNLTTPKREIRKTNRDAITSDEYREIYIDKSQKVDFDKLNNRRNLKKIVTNNQESFIKVETSIPNSIFTLLDEKCKKLGIEVSHSLNLLILNEVRSSKGIL